jgi:hypothetical protein
MKTLLWLIIGLVGSVSYAQGNSLFNLDNQIKTYTDCLGRTTLEPANIPECKKENYDTNNALLFTGELVILMKELKGVPSDIKKQITTFLPKHFIKPGLLSRHPEPYRFRKDMKPISFDEFTGVAFMASVIPELRPYVDDIVKYGLENNWQYWDMPGYEKGKSWFELLYPTALLQWIPYLQEENLRRGTVRYNKLYPLFATHHFHQRAFYKMMSLSYKPNWIEEAYFVGASLLAEYTDSSSSFAMWLFRYKALEHRNYQSPMIKWASSHWREKMREKFGEQYDKVIFQMYYESKDHPFHHMAEIKYLPSAIKNDILKQNLIDK